MYIMIHVYTYLITRAGEVYSPAGARLRAPWNSAWSPEPGSAQPQLAYEPRE